ncbi:tetratricopeptide repeat protein [Campylobacter concisus]|uniref:tetratricopeptide repeat protein n=1 Tax=Campylobacter concisus TaxID=199 RepID=UPI000CD84142|nr:SEL1-like repeat protein [Campylobacter concisus]
MKKFIFLSILLLTIGFSQDLFELGREAYKKGDYKKAAELYEIACNSGDTSGCLAAGILHENGQGVKQDYHRAFKLYEKACDFRLQLGCDGYKDLNKKGF